MFCPKCGESNPDNGKFCRSCGTDLGGVTSALTGRPTADLASHVNRKGKPISWESALVKTAMGVAFLIISFILAATGSGRGWWFWMLIPAFIMLAGGIAQIIQLNRPGHERGGYSPADLNDQLPGGAGNTLPPPQPTDWVTPDTSRYKTGDLVPPSVTDATTRHLEVDKEGKTMTLPKK